MPNRTITLTNDDDALLGEVASAAGSAVDDYLQSQVERRLNTARINKISRWFDALPLVDKQRIYDTESA